MFRRNIRWVAHKDEKNYTFQAERLVLNCQHHGFRWNAMKMIIISLPTKCSYGT